MKTIIKQYLVLLCTLCVSMCFATAYGDNQTVFYESFNNCAGAGGNDNVWNPQGATSPIAYDNTGWSATGSVYGANQCARVGTSSAKVTLTTPALAYSGTAKLCLTFKSAPWKTEASKMTVSLNNGTISQSADAAGNSKSITFASNMTTSQWNEYTLYLSGVDDKTTISFSGSKNRFFLDEVKVEEVGAAPVKTLTSVALSGTPTHNTYTVGDSFDPTGLTVTATYSDNSTADVTSNATWEFDPATFETAGRQSVLVSATYNGKTDLKEYSVNVTAASYLLAKLGTFTATNGTLNEDNS